MTNHWKKPSAAALLYALSFATVSAASTLYWTEASFATPRLITADASGTIKNTVVLAPYSLPQDVAVSADSERLFFTELTFVNAHVNYASATLAAPVPVVALQSCLRGIAVDSAHKKIYWTSTNLAAGSAVYRANLDGSSAEALLAFGTAGSNAPYGIAINESTQVMYWADFDGGTIMRASAAPSPVPQTVVTGLSGPVGVALDADSGALFWTDANAGSIGRAGLDGSGVTTIARGLDAPQYCALDRAAGKIYWTEFGSARVRSANYDGSDTMTVASTVGPPVGIAVLGAPPVALRPAARLSPRVFSMSASVSGTPARSLRIRYDLPWDSRVSLLLFDARGRRVVVLPETDVRAGSYVRDIDTGRLAGGVWYMRFSAGGFVKTAACTLAK
jgi:hypothetical protein